MNPQEEFIMLVNAYYQFDAVSKMMFNADVQPEIIEFYRSLNDSPLIKQALMSQQKNMEKGILEKKLIKAKLKTVFSVDDNFLRDIENSISFVKSENGNIIYYRNVFLEASITLFNFIKQILPIMDDNFTIQEAIYLIVTDILLKDYWEGADVLKQINSIRTLKKELHYSDNWIKEYATIMQCC